MPWGEAEYKKAKALVDSGKVDPEKRGKLERGIAEYEGQRTEQLREEVASPQPRDEPDPGADTSWTEALGSAVAQGMSLGWADEIYPKVVSAIDPNLRPEFLQDEMRTAVDRGREQHPVTSMAGELAGGAAMGAAGAAAGSGLLAATPLAGMLSRVAANPAARRAIQGGMEGAAGGAVAGAGTAEEGSRAEGAGLGAAIGGPLGGVMPALGRGASRMADRWRGRAPLTKEGMETVLEERGMDGVHEFGRDIEATGLHKGRGLGHLKPAGQERYARNAEQALADAGQEIEQIVSATRGPLTPDDLGKRTRGLPKPMNRPSPEQARQMSKAERVDFMRENFAPGAAGQSRSQPDPDLGAELFAEPNPEAGVVVDLGPVHDSLRKVQGEMHRIAQQVPEAQAYENQIAKRADLYWETPYSDYETAWKARVFLDGLAHDATGQKAGQQAAMLRRVSGQVQEQLEEAIKKHRPELHDQLKAANKKYSTASKVLRNARSKFASQETREMTPWEMLLPVVVPIARRLGRVSDSAGAGTLRGGSRVMSRPAAMTGPIGSFSEPEDEGER